MNEKFIATCFRIGGDALIGEGLWKPSFCQRKVSLHVNQLASFCPTTVRFILQNHPKSC